MCPHEPSRPIDAHQYLSLLIAIIEMLLATVSPVTAVKFAPRASSRSLEVPASGGHVLFVSSRRLGPAEAIARLRWTGDIQGLPGPSASASHRLCATGLQRGGRSVK